MIRTRLMAIATAVPVVLLAAACGSSGHAASGTPATGSPPATRTPGLAASATTSASPTAASPAGPASPTASPPATTSACAAMAAHTFVHVTAVKSGMDGSLTLTGNPATVVCGGPDDLHYNLATTTVTGHVLPGASITVFPLPAMHPVAIGAGKLASYLATDKDTRIFLITGPLSRITGLQEEYHP